MQMIYSTYLLADGLRAPNGCPPRWIHLISENDAPTRNCSDFHQKLSWHPETSYATFFEGPYYESDGAPNGYAPLSKMFEWTTLWMPHAATLARAKHTIYSKWERVLNHDYCPGDHWCGIDFGWPTSEFKWGVADEWTWHTELNQRGMRLWAPVRPFYLSLCTFAHMSLAFHSNMW